MDILVGAGSLKTQLPFTKSRWQSLPKVSGQKQKIQESLKPLQYQPARIFISSPTLRLHYP